MKHWTKRLLAPAALAFACAAGAHGQEAPPAQDDSAPKQDEAEEPAPEQDEEEELPGLNPFGGSGSGAPAGEDEMRELFLKVDKRLTRVTELLYEASSGDGSRAEEIGSAGIDELIRGAESASSSAQGGIAKLLEASERQSRAASEEIQLILDIAAQNPSSSGGGGGGNDPQSGEGQPQPQQGQTPSGSRREDKGQDPSQQQGENQQQQQDPSQQQGGNQPDNTQPNSDEQPTNPSDPRSSEQGPEAAARGTEDWGDLPIHLRKVFQNSVSDDVPPRYRDWVDAYYERLRRSSPR
ncbi:MAG: hypothetical protein AAFP22_02185 [Planctomycetota bacterium]